MLFYNPQLMPNEQSARLFMVSSTQTVDDYQSHEAHLQLRVQQLITEARNSGEDPVMLIEEYLACDYPDTIENSSLAAYILQHDRMQSALWTLQELWGFYDPELPSDSLYFKGMDTQEALETYAQVDLRSFLEALAGYTIDD